MCRGLVELFLHRLGLDIERDALVGEEHEVLDEDGGGLLESLLRVDGPVGLDVEGELLIVSALLYAIVVDGIHDLLDGGVYGVDGDDTDGVGGTLVLVGGHIATALVDAERDVQLGSGLHVANLKVRVEDLEAVEVAIEVAGLENGLILHGEGDLLGVGVLKLTAEADLLKAQDDVGHILDHTGYGGELMVDTVDLHRGNSIAFERREKDATQSVADGSAITGLQRAEFKSAAEVVSFKHDHLVRFLE